MCRLDQLLFAGFFLLLSRGRCDGPPIFLKSVKKEYTVSVGTTVKLKCLVSGANDPLHNRTLTAWQKVDNGGTEYVKKIWKRFKMKSGKHLKISRVQVEDSGTYICIARNAFGVRKEEIKLTVQASNSSGITVIPPMTSTGPNTRVLVGQRPSFKRALSSSHRTSTHSEGETLRLKCHASGDPKPSIKWKKDGRKLSKVQRSYRVGSGWILLFGYLLTSDAGTYTCIVSNQHGIINRTFAVRVIAPTVTTIKPEKPEIKTQRLRNVTAVEGDDVTFICATISAVKPRYHWIKWNTEWTANYSGSHPKVVIITPIKDKVTFIWEAGETQPNNINLYVQKLRITNVSLSDRGKYTCHVKHSGGFTSANAFLAVRPKWNEGPSGVSTIDPQVVQRRRKSLQPTEISVAVFVAIPLAFVVVLIFAIAWCYVQIKRQRSRFEAPVAAQPTLNVVENVPPQTWQIVHRVDKNAYVEHPRDRKHCEETDSCDNLTQTRRSPVFDELIVHRTSIEELHSENRCCQHSSSTDHSSESLSSESKTTAI